MFDLDGTLVDSRRDLAEAANELLAGYGAAPLAEEDVGRMVGEGAGVLVSRVLASRGLDVPHPEALARYLEVYDRRMLDHTRPYDGIPEALDEIGRWARLATLTNKPAHATGRMLEALALAPRFAWVIGGDSSFGRKPAPDALRWLMESAGTVPAHTVLVGDSVTDVLTARNAATQVCIARYGFGYLNMPPGFLDGSESPVDHPSELPAILASLIRETP